MLRGRANDAKAEAKKLLHWITADNGKSPGRSEETISCNFYFGNRLDNAQIQSLCLTWEAKHGRNALIDNVRVLRAAAGSTPDDDELYLILKQCSWSNALGSEKSSWRSGRLHAMTLALI